MRSKRIRSPKDLGTGATCIVVVIAVVQELVQVIEMRRANLTKMVVFTLYVVLPKTFVCVEDLSARLAPFASLDVE